MSTELQIDEELSTPRRQQILADELNAVLSKLDHSFSTVLEDVVEHLFAKAESCANNRESQLFLDAYNNIRKQSGEIQLRFKRNFRALLDEGIGARPVKSNRHSADDWMELSLVDTDKVEEDVQVQKLCDKIKSSVEWELRDLNARMSYLMGRESAEEQDNPLRPENFCRAIGKVCAELESDHTVRLELLRGFEAALSQNLSTVYHDLNARLISYRVLPKIRHGHQTRRASPKSKSGDFGYESDYQGELGRVTEVVENVVEGTLSIFEALQKLVGNTPAYRGQPGIADPGNPAQSRRNLMSAIQELRHVQDAFSAPLGADNVAPGLPNFIWANRDQLSAAAGSQVDRMKIDIVAMLFDQILADDKLPAEFKTLLGRLQLPVLRVALADGSFFASRAHPTRRLIDRIATCAVGYERNGTDATGSRFEAEVERIVNAVLQNVEDDVAVYDRLRDEFDQFIANEHNNANDIVGRAANVLERAEIRETLAINATIQVNQLLYGVSLAPALRAFLLDVWTHVLVEAACAAKDSKADPTVTRFKDLCVDLVWSAQPKVNPEERRRLVNKLPSLIATIREGLAMIGYPFDEETRFFSELMQIHSAAVRAPNATLEEQERVDDFATRLHAMIVENDVNVVERSGERQLSVQAVRRVVAESQGEVELVDLATGPSTAADAVLPSDDLVEHWVEVLERGAWYELRIEGEFSRVRLAWISPLRTFYLFVPADGLKSHSLQPDALKRALRNGDLRTVEKETLVDRAVRSVMSNLERQQVSA